ncbi:hypothetical protein [Actinophytocola algeriensis]|uniref:Uncharacterized protein n=1 Tax=Actinophytocola algeriensis TaxID=1768010 RepID=A0A7W7VCL3_9PSEU|nr:hypothetical protein [Actinophytocola algeriensis]MBB4905251.1 hypothetical protein [Actinophytocola algeriensis]MBE1473064.1 hypothetical protein [Actinophytocola algeriensis]
MTVTNTRALLRRTGVTLACTLAMTALGGVASASPAAAPGDHVPLSVAPADCDSIPSDRDIAVTTTVHDVGVSLGASDKVMLAGFEAGWVESHMNNLPCGDQDSLGVFQQRPSQGWGTPEQIMDVTYAATQFFTQAIHNEPLYPDYTAGLLAQSVQRSCCPERYDQSEGKALEMLAEVRAEEVR